ncbi:MAG: glucose-6-phosphate dehydrogenase [Kiritimatiellae bacterium]|nr:glucose-6-phosphate dehydrogenase [Kiritimatiellia bacterium]
MRTEYPQTFFSIEVIPAPSVIIIFGATGDLTRRKLLPSLCQLLANNLLHQETHIVACGRTVHTNDSFHSSIKEYLSCSSEVKKCDLFKYINYLRVDPAEPRTLRDLSARLEELGQLDSSAPLNHLFYFAVPPDSTEPLVTALAREGLLVEDENKGWRHLALEKPFGTDLASALALDQFLHRHVTEDQIFRIDHYLAKETVQNILITRFANRIFESIWDNRAIDYIQISTSETVGLEGRNTYFDKSGMLRDMIQNHLTEILMLVAMEPPVSFEANAIHDAKFELAKAIRPFTQATIKTDVIRAQYSAAGKTLGYRQEPGIPADSQTETFVAMKLLIDNPRWQGVPFYLQAGKRMNTTDSEIKIVFKPSSRPIYGSAELAKSLAPNSLTLRIRPDEGICINLQAKLSGPKLAIGNLRFNTTYGEQSTNLGAPDDYARLLLDAMLHDHTLFVRGDTITESWRIFTPVLEAWQRAPEQYPLLTYPAGSQGPDFDL